MNTRTEMTYPSNSDVEVFLEEVQVNMTHLLANIDIIKEYAPEYEDFAISLCAYFDEHGRLSTKQAYHACRFWQLVNNHVGEAGGKVAPVPSARKDETPPRVVINGSSLIAMFDKASQELKYPSIKYYVEQGMCLPTTVSHIKFYRTGASNRRYGAGCVMCIFERPDDVDNAREVLLVIARDGKTAFGKYCFAFPALQQMLKKIIEQPIEAFKMNGIKYAHCCFCGQELVTKESVTAGYGPICASKYGLPWGEVPEQEMKLEDL